MLKHYLLASDFDQTLSFNDSGVALSELIGFHGFHDKVKGLAEMNLVQQGAELSYLILHDPEFRRVRRDHQAGAQFLVLALEYQQQREHLDGLAQAHVIGETGPQPQAGE